MCAAKTVRSRRSEPHIIKFDNDEENGSTAGKPCIDFQPDDRWQIKEGEDNEDATVSSSLKGGKRRKLRNRRKNPRPSQQAPAKPASEMNGESANAELVKDDSSDTIFPSDEQVGSTDDVEVCPKKLCNSSQQEEEEHQSKNGEGVQSESENSKKRQRSTSPAGRSDSPADIASENKKIRLTSESNENCSNSTENSPSLKEDACDEEVCTGSENTSKSVSDDDKSTAAPVLQDERIDEKLEKGECSSSSETSKNCDMPDLSSSENAPESRNDDKIVESTDKECTEIIVSDGEESESEIQVISSTSSRKKKEVKAKNQTFPAEQSLIAGQGICDEKVLLSAGYPYFNSLQEKIEDFRAGKYKPVKFPHLGTLMLEEHEVIIESPSLLVPLLIKEKDEFPPGSEETEAASSEDTAAVSSSKSSPVFKRNFFQSSVGQFLINLGGSRVLEWYHRDLKRSKMKQVRKSGHSQQLDDVVVYHTERYNSVKESNSAFNFRLRKCQFCDFKTESRLILDAHYLTPHLSMRREYKCNFCVFLTRDAKEIAFHFEAIHGKRAFLEDQMMIHECLFCSFQSHLKSKVNGHMNRCRKNFIASQNLSPPFDFEFPGVTTKPVTITDVVAHRRMLMGSAKGGPYPNAGQSATMDSFMSAFARKKLASVLNISGSEAFPDSPTLVKHLMGQQSKQPGSGFQLPPGIVLTRPRVRSQQVRQPVQNLHPRAPGARQPGAPRNSVPYLTNISSTATQLASSGVSITPITKQDSSSRVASGSQPGMKNITLTPISSAGNQVVSQKPGPPQPVALFTNVAGSDASRNRTGMTQPGRMPVSVAGRPSRMIPPYQRLSTPPSQVVKNSSGSTFVMCEICDSYIKDLDELRSHMNWVHKVKIHPKMLVSRPPLNCQKCQWRFFTDQGLERHLLGAHGLVTTNMQEMANKNQDGGRCIICGAVFTYKLVSHMTQVHKVTLKPAHLSYKCTVCTATFTLYRLFESHVYNVHSASAKRPAEESSAEPPAKKPVVSENQVKPKEIKKETKIVKPVVNEKPVVLPAPEPVTKKCKECGIETDDMEQHIIDKHMKRCYVKVCRIEKCQKCLYSSDEMLLIRLDELGLDSGDEDSSEEEEEESEDEVETEQDSSEKATGGDTEASKESVSGDVTAKELSGKCEGAKESGKSK